MANVIGVRFRAKGKVSYCAADGTALQVGDYVVVNTGHGFELARVVTLEAPGEAIESDRQGLAVVRKAENDDLEKAKYGFEQEALTKCREMVAKLGLPMKPLTASYDLKNERMIIFFSAQEKVDFRGLVRRLSHELQSKVELRQVGARDEAKLIGGIGKCGYPLCCQRFLTSFASVSIKMAKEQNLALNPMKISGICGKLLCCLAYEREEYVALKEKMPRLNQEVLTPWGKAKVLSANYLKETVKVQLEDGTTKELALEELIQGR